MGEQSYQEVSDIIKSDLIGLYKLGVRDLNKIKTSECKGDYHDYFFYRKSKYPQRYERLNFDKNGHRPICEDLGSIMDDFIICGFLGYGKILNLENVDNIKSYMKMWDITS